MNKSKRPTIIVGGGIRISKTEKNLKSLLNKLNIPIVTTWSGLDAVSHEHKNYIGTIEFMETELQILQFKIVILFYHWEVDWIPESQAVYQKLLLEEQKLYL